MFGKIFLRDCNINRSELVFNMDGGASAATEVDANLCFTDCISELVFSYLKDTI